MPACTAAFNWAGLVLVLATLLKAARAYWNPAWTCSAVPDVSDRCELEIR